MPESSLSVSCGKRTQAPYPAFLVPLLAEPSVNWVLIGGKARVIALTLARRAPQVVKGDGTYEELIKKATGRPNTFDQAFFNFWVLFIQIIPSSSIVTFPNPPHYTLFFK